MNFRVPYKAGNFFTSCGTIACWQRSPLSGVSHLSFFVYGTFFEKVDGNPH
jgi:hypothetical protein